MHYIKIQMTQLPGKKWSYINKQKTDILLTPQNSLHNQQNKNE